MRTLNLNFEETELESLERDKEKEMKKQGVKKLSWKAFIMTKFDYHLKDNLWRKSR